MAVSFFKKRPLVLESPRLGRGRARLGESKIQITARNGPWKLSRRNILTGMIAGATLVATGRAAKAACALTPSQIGGPFYPLAIQDYDWDLTGVSGGSGQAEG